MSKDFIFGANRLKVAGFLSCLTGLVAFANLTIEPCVDCVGDLLELRASAIVKLQVGILK